MICELTHPTQSLEDAKNRRLTAAVGMAVAVALVAAALRLCRRVVVAGASMRPALEPGDRVLVVPALRLRPGQILAVPDPREPGRLLLKRLLSADSGLVDVRGDNESASTDSRDFGPIPRSSVMGRAVYRYAPSERAGWLSE